MMKSTFIFLTRSAARRERSICMRAIPLPNLAYPSQAKKYSHQVVTKTDIENKLTYLNRYRDHQQSGKTRYQCKPHLLSERESNDTNKNKHTNTL